MLTSQKQRSEPRQHDSYARPERRHTGTGFQRRYHRDGRCALYGVRCNYHDCHPAYHYSNREFQNPSHHHCSSPHGSAGRCARGEESGGYGGDIWLCGDDWEFVKGWVHYR